jgi:FHA domain
MNFIRNIIAEKRGTAPQVMPKPAPAFGERFDEAAPAKPLIDAIAAPLELTDRTDVVSKAPEVNIFTVDGSDAGTAPAGGQNPSGMAAAHGFFAEPAAEEARVDGDHRDDGALWLTKFAAPHEDAAPARQVLAAAAQTAVSAAIAAAHQPDLSEMPFVSVQPKGRADDVVSDAGLQVPPPAAGRGSSRSGRVKTRLLGFNPESLGLANPFEKAESRTSDAFPVAWLVVVDGPGRGASYALHDGVSRIGRGDDQTVCLNFGDNSISRENHLSIAYDAEQNAFYIGQSGRSNIVRLNNKPLLSTEQVRNGDQIRVGETTLRLAALCSEDFSWTPKS